MNKINHNHRFSVGMRSLLRGRFGLGTTGIACSKRMTVLMFAIVLVAAILLFHSDAASQNTPETWPQEILKSEISRTSPEMADEDTSISFAYRPWPIFRRRTITLPGGGYFIGKGLISPTLRCGNGDDSASCAS